MPLYNYRGQDVMVSVKAYGARGDGTGDDTAAIQAAIDAVPPGGSVYFPRGRYRVNNTLTITKHYLSLTGDVGFRNNGTSQLGSQILYYGTSSLFKIGDDDGLAWNLANYNGYQGTMFSNLALKHNDAQSDLSNGLGIYRAGTHAIRDWRGGGIVAENLFVENFEYSFWGVQSDINQFRNFTQLYSKYGIYLGPRSDQNSMYDMYAWGCDTALTLDQCTHCRVTNAQIVDCGSNVTFAVNIRGGTTGAVFDNPWLEQFNGYNGEQNAWIAAGINAGYDGVTTLVNDVAIIHPQISCNPQANTRRVKYILAGDNCIATVEQPHGNVNNLSRIFGAYGSSTGVYIARNIGLSVSGSNLIANNGTGSPQVYADLFSNDERRVINGNSRFVVERNPLNPSPGENTYRISTPLGHAIAIDFPNSATQAAHVRWDRRIQPGTAAPATNTWAVGDYIQNTAPAEAGTAGSKYVTLGWICTVAGTPGTWLPCRALTGN